MTLNSSMLSSIVLSLICWADSCGMRLSFACWQVRAFRETNQKTLLNDKVENIFFKLDQVVNICFEDEKQDYLPTTAVILITIETNEKNLGSLKALINFSKQEIYKNLNQVLESIKNNPNLTF